MKNKYKFMNDILKPWDDLNKLLVNPYCVEPNLSSITKMASDIATSISHFAEVSEIDKRWKIANESFDNKLMIDIADMNKHGKLNDETRHNTISVASMFEYIDENKFKFLRNKIIVEHVSHGSFDFMEISLKAIMYWIERLELVCDRNILISDSEIASKATLIFNPDYCIHAESARYNFLKKNIKKILIPYDPNARYKFLANNIKGILIPYDPPRFYIEILDMKGNVTTYADVVINRIQENNVMTEYTDIFIPKLDSKYEILKDGYIYIDNYEELIQLNLLEPSLIFQGFVPIDLIEDDYVYINKYIHTEEYI